MQYCWKSARVKVPQVMRRMAAAALGLALWQCLAARCDDFDSWGLINHHSAKMSASRYFGTQSLRAGPMPIRPGKWQGSAALDATMWNFGMFYQLPENLKSLRGFAARESRDLSGTEWKRFSVLMSTDGFGNATSVVGLREVGGAQFVQGRSGPDGFARSPSSLPVSAGEVWVSRWGYSTLPPTPSAPWMQARWPIAPPLGMSLRGNSQPSLGVNMSLGQPSSILRPLPRPQPSLGVDTRMPTSLPGLPKPKNGAGGRTPLP
jgi:hypothetical protein